MVTRFLTIMMLSSAMARAGDVQRIRISAVVPGVEGIFPGIDSSTISFPGVSYGLASHAPGELPSGFYLHAEDLDGGFGVSDRAADAPPKVSTAADVLTAPLRRSRIESTKILTQKAFADALSGSDMFEGRPEKEGEDYSSPRYLAVSSDGRVDRNSLVPFSRALRRYGLNASQIEGLVRIFESLQDAEDSSRLINGRIRGIRAANLMAQYFAGKEFYQSIPSDIRLKRALIVAALFHRTPQLSGSAPFKAWLKKFDSMSDISEGDRILSLILATYPEMDRPFKGPILSDYFDAGLSRSLDATMQFVTRAALFVDGAAFGEAAVRALAAQARAAAPAPRAAPSDDAAIVAAAAELHQILFGRMPADPRHAFSLEPGEPRKNLTLTERHMRRLAADILNRRAFTPTWKPEDR